MVLREIWMMGPRLFNFTIAKNKVCQVVVFVTLTLLVLKYSPMIVIKVITSSYIVFADMNKT